MTQDISVNTQVASQTMFDAKQQAQSNDINSVEGALIQSAVKEITANSSLSHAENKQENDVAGDQQSEQISRDQMEQLAENLQEFISSFNKSLKFSVDEESGRDVITVTDKGSGEVIRQYPSEEVLKLMSRLADSAGLLVQTEV